MDALSDEELMQAYQLGDATAFNEIYRRYSPKTYGHMSKRLPKDEVDDVHQQAFMALHRSRALYDPRRPFAPWFYVLVHNSIMDAHRVRGRKTDAQKTLIQEIAGDAGMEADTSAVEGALSSLNCRYRDALIQRYHRDLDFEDIAKEAGVSAAGARQLVSRGLRALKAILQKDKI